LLLSDSQPQTIGVDSLADIKGAITKRKQAAAAAPPTRGAAMYTQKKPPFGPGSALKSTATAEVPTNTSRNVPKSSPNMWLYAVS
jgi:hypothetical protein